MTGLGLLNLIYPKRLPVVEAHLDPVTEETDLRIKRTA